MPAFSSALTSSVTATRRSWPRRRIWLYAFTRGFMLLDDPPADAVPLLWSQVTDVTEV